jgi:hypothetical protein
VGWWLLESAGLGGIAPDLRAVVLRSRALRLPDPPVEPSFDRFQPLFG